VRDVEQPRLGLNRPVVGSVSSVEEVRDVEEPRVGLSTGRQVGIEQREVRRAEQPRMGLSGFVVGSGSSSGRCGVLNNHGWG
jgi:hypothetical protein